MLNEYVSLTDRNLLAGPAQDDQLTYTIGKLISYPVTCAPVSNSCILISFVNRQHTVITVDFHSILRPRAQIPWMVRLKMLVVSHSQLTAAFSSNTLWPMSTRSKCLLLGND